MKRDLRGATVLLLLCGVLVGIGVLVPISSLLWESFTKPSPSGTVVTLDNYVRILTRPRTYSLLATTLAFSTCLTLVAGSVGLLFAWAAARTNVPFRRFMPIAILLPYLIPPTMGAIVWTWLLTPRTGLINMIAAPLLGNSFFNVYSFSGMVFVESAYAIPLAFMFFHTTLVALNPTLEEASAVSGASGFQTFLHTVLPNMWPAILSVATILFIIGFESFDVAWFIGYPAKIYILAIELYTMTRISFPVDVAGASVYGVIAILLAFALIALYRRVIRNQVRFASITGKAYHRGVTDIGGGRHVICALFYGFVALVGVLPLLTLTLMSFKLMTLPFAVDLHGSLENFRWIFSDTQSLRGIRNTAEIAVLGALTTLAVGFLVAYAITRTQERGRSLLEYMAFLPFATPSTVLALGIIAILVWTPLYNTIWIMMVAFAIKFLPYALRSVSSTLIQIHPELEEASFVSGASLWTTMRRVVVPIAVPGLIAAWSMLLIIYSRQFSLPMMLASADSQVITTSMFNEWDSGAMGHVAAYGLLLGLCCLPLLILARILDNRSAAP